MTFFEFSGFDQVEEEFPRFSIGSVSKSFMREKCGYLACISVRNKLKLFTTCKGDPTAGLIRDNGNAVEIAGFLIDDTNPGRLGVPLHQCDGYFEKRCDPFVCSCGNIIESDENTEDDGESVEDFCAVVKKKLYIHLGCCAPIKFP